MKDSGNGQAPHTAKEDGCLRYYRFYPVVDGEDQGVGLFHVLSDSGIPVAKQKALLRRFDEHLPFPQLSAQRHILQRRAWSFLKKTLKS